MKRFRVWGLGFRASDEGRQIPECWTPCLLRASVRVEKFLETMSPQLKALKRSRP